ncbi:hypothetical protein BC351_29115 [Paenibacillus ferrarius]|uniref:Uncharacterized protein n=1 Tax=Paenibacillus ferrarius TaxID=1469647 RepID=A0A1V4HHF1_9BACL|nr:hypothetical protein [Paenibacillus ferrarius]OPH56229.1 hypothetical protein BC351_29115 [Paenibacillus ferrarius]
MLTVKAEISFGIENLSQDLSTKHILRPSINFGDNLLFSGTILADSDVDELIRGRRYKVTIELPTVEQEAYEHIRHLVQIGNIFTLQNASKVLGKGEIMDFMFV